MVINTERNINIARTYISIKLLAVGILESIAILTGGDVPLCYFIGTLDNNAGLDLGARSWFLPR